MKYTLYLKQNMPFASCPSIVELEAERILANDVTLPGDFNPYNTRLWVIGNEFGAMGAVWAQNESDALDELVDAGLGGGLLVDDPEPGEDDETLSYLGNAGEPADLTHAWLGVVDFHATHNAHVLAILLKFAEARGAGAKNLDEL